jgi:predicted membrane GTPase involved in stress response
VRTSRRCLLALATAAGVVAAVTPATIRVRKVVLDQTERGKAKNRKPKPA